MLAREGKLDFAGKTYSITPLLVPSFSSKGFPELRDIIAFMRAFIDGSTLVSAYDVHYGKMDPRKLTFPNLIFLDSGGYEARVEHDLSEAYGHEYQPAEWSTEFYRDVLKNWKTPRPTVAVTYDSPRRYMKTERQIAAGATTFSKYTGFIPEILLKPERKAEPIIVEKILPHVSALSAFAVIGFTERELGTKIIDRMVSVARLRKALDEAGVSAPIHIFGSLDTLSTVLYFISGAEIFDGLTWLRFGYAGGQTIYAQQFGAVQVANGLLQESTELTTSMWKENYYYLQSLRDQMIAFARTSNFVEFKDIGSYVESAYEKLKSRLPSGGA